MLSKSFASCLVTLAVVVPVGWHALGASVAVDGKRVRPLQQSFTIDGTRVTVDVDRGLAMTGDSVTAKLVAFNATPKPVVVDLTLLQSHNYAGERVEQPEIAIDHEKLTLQAAPDGGPPVTTKLVLGKRPAMLGQLDDFRIYVAPHGHKPPVLDEDEHRLDYTHDVTEGTAAAIAITGWSGNSLGISIVPQGPITLDAPFTVAVTIHNTGRRLPDLSVQLGTLDARLGNVDAGADFDIENADADADETDHSLEKHGERIERFVVTPKSKTAKQVTFVAEVEAWDEQPGPVIAGAMDAKTFPITETKHEVATK